jgi:hypothetical protein
MQHKWSRMVLSLLFHSPPMMLLANMEMATKPDYGCEFSSTMHTIHKKYMHNHVQDATLLQIILKELVGADG